jgi:hypothetical protein
MVLPPAALLQLRRGPVPAGAGIAGLASPRPGATALVAVVLVERREEGAKKREVVVLSTELLR